MGGSFSQPILRCPHRDQAERAYEEARLHEAFVLYEQGLDSALALGIAYPDPELRKTLLQLTPKAMERAEEASVCVCVCVCMCMYVCVAPWGRPVSEQTQFVASMSK